MAVGRSSLSQNAHELHDRMQSSDRSGHPLTICERATLGATCQQAGNHQAAILLLEHAAADLDRLLGADHPNTLDYRTKLGAAYTGAARAREAIAVLKRASAATERAFGPDSRLTLNTRGSLARAGGGAIDSRR